MKKLISIMILLSLLLGCKKYPDDDNSFHLLTVKKRLCTVCWNSDQYQGDNSCMSFKKDSSYIGLYYPIGFKGTWKLIDHKNKLRFTNSSNNTTYDFTIIRLERESDGRPVLWLKNDTATFYFIEHKD